MSPCKSSLLAALVAVVGTSGSLTVVQRRRSAELAHWQSANAQLRYDAQRRVHLTSGAMLPAGGNGAADAPARPEADASTQSVRSASAVEPDRPAAPERDYRDLGQATPEATLQTLAWAGDRGDVERMRGLIVFDPVARQLAEAYFASLPPALHTQFADLNGMAAALLTRAIMGQPYPEAEVLATGTFAPVGDDASLVRLSLPGTGKDGQLYQRDGGVWKYVITEQLVRSYFARHGVSAPPAEGPAAPPGQP